jgi:hypothetical protein
LATLCVSTWIHGQGSKRVCKRLVALGGFFG